MTATTPEDSYLQQLFSELGLHGVDYALARDYDTLPFDLAGRDLDIIVQEGQLPRAVEAAARAARLSSARTFRIDQERAVWLLVVAESRSWALRIDFAEPQAITWRGVPFLDQRGAFSRRVSEGGLPRLHRDDITVMQLSRDLTGRLDLRARYKETACELHLRKPRFLQEQLESIFGRRGAARILSLVDGSAAVGLPELGKRLRRAAMLRKLLRRPGESTAGLLRYLSCRVREFFQPMGRMIALLGPDGVGKGTALEEIRSAIPRLLHFPVAAYHWRPELLPSLGSVFHGRVEDGRPVTNPHRLSPSSPLVSLFRVAYYTTDYILGYWLRVRPLLGRKCIVAVFDRYFYDYFIDPIRSRVSAPRWVLRGLLKAVPQPSLVVFLHGDPEAIFERTRELDVDEISRQIASMRGLSGSLCNVLWIETTRPKELWTRELLDKVLLTVQGSLNEVKG